ncbi:hypothetical protein Ahy_B10g105091 [Arachis hypogaea]|uniref:Uncharacterized protein n=1 Tax=Arachis hypogaea TaxID=3818 RepID=A0A444X780_ARAHY|nr:hypothetical protein Ahy_B10g105091 [Arachis hypogaea]
MIGSSSQGSGSSSRSRSHGTWARTTNRIRAGKVPQWRGCEMRPILRWSGTDANSERSFFVLLQTIGKRWCRLFVWADEEDEAIVGRVDSARDVDHWKMNLSWTIRNLEADVRVLKIWNCVLSLFVSSIVKASHHFFLRGMKPGVGINFMTPANLAAAPELAPCIGSIFAAATSCPSLLAVSPLCSSAPTLAASPVFATTTALAAATASDGFIVSLCMTVAPFSVAFCPTIDCFCHIALIRSPFALPPLLYSEFPNRFNEVLFSVELHSYLKVVVSESSSLIKLWEHIITIICCVLIFAVWGSFHLFIVPGGISIRISKIWIIGVDLLADLVTGGVNLTVVVLAAFVGLAVVSIDDLGFDVVGLASLVVVDFVGALADALGGGSMGIVGVKSIVDYLVVVWGGCLYLGLGWKLKWGLEKSHTSLDLLIIKFWLGHSMFKVNMYNSLVILRVKTHLQQLRIM